MSQKKYTTEGRWLLATLTMLLGGLLMVILVISFNKSVQEKEKVEKKQFRVMKSAKSQKKATKPKPKPKSKPRKAQPKAPLPNMNSALSGLAMDIPEFASENIAGNSSDLLKDIVEDAIMNENTVDVKPKVLSRSPLEYPEEALKNGIKGYVVLNMLIEKDGSVDIAKVLDSKPAGVFDNAALNAVRSWRFSPAKYKAKPVRMWAKQKIRFK